jgi:hypothetical protein
MANQNPISLDVRPTSPTGYNVSETFKDTMLYITVKIQLKDKGWQFAGFHSVSLRGKDIYPNKLPEPSDLKLDYAKDLKEKKLFITSHISRFREDSENETPVIVKYSLKIEAGDTLLDEFIKESDTKNPSNFYSFIIFNLVP